MRRRLCAERRTRAQRTTRTATSSAFRIELSEDVPGEGVAVSAIAWIGVGAALWVVVAVPLALLVGRVIRGRDEQVPAVAVPTSSRSTTLDRNGSGRGPVPPSPAAVGDLPAHLHHPPA